MDDQRATMTALSELHGARVLSVVVTDHHGWFDVEMMFDTGHALKMDGYASEASVKLMRDGNILREWGET